MTEEQEIIHKLEKKFPFLESIYHLRESNDSHIFSCIDSGVPSTLVVDKDGWVMSKPNINKFSDVLGQI